MPLSFENFKTSSQQALLALSRKNGVNEIKNDFLRRSELLPSCFTNLELAKNRATAIRWKSIENLDKYLIQFEANCIRSGIRVLWAQDRKQVTQEIDVMLKKSNARTVSYFSGELEEELQLLNYFGEQKEYDLELTDNRKGRSLIAPGNSISNTSGHQSITKKRSDIHIAEVCFLAADTGTIVISSTETRLYPESKINVYIASIDSITSSLSDIDLLTRLQSGHDTGCGNVPFIKLINSCNRQGDVSGEAYVILMDNGRSSLLESEVQRQSLYCIKCGACQGICPVVSSIGLTGGEGSFKGPLAFAAIPQLHGKKEHSYLAYASPLCGKCNDVCPVRIDFKKAMLTTRQEAVKNKLAAQSDRWFYILWKKAMMKREFIQWSPLDAYRTAVEKVFLRSRSGQRQLPGTASKSFNQQWRDKNSIT